MTMQWVSTKDSSPTTEVGAQVKVLFYSHGWAAPMYGLYTHWQEGGEWAEYDQQNDRYHDIRDSWPRVPEFWTEVTRPN